MDISRNFCYTKTFDFKQRVETYKVNMHAGHMLHCTENLLEVYWCLQKDGKENNQQGGMGHTKLYWYKLDFVLWLNICLALYL